MYLIPTLEVFSRHKIISYISRVDKIHNIIFLISSMAESSKDSSDHDLFVTEFPKKGFGIVDYLQGRMHFALMDQMKLMSKSGMKQEQIKDAIIKTVTEIVDNFEPKKESESS